MPTTTVQRATVVAPLPPSTPRVALAPASGGRTVLDGAWWPRSWDPVAELPGLVLALSARYGPVRQIMLNGLAWQSRFRRLAVGPQVVRVGWFASLDPALLIATTDRGHRVDVLVVPPGTAEAAARAVMACASDPANTMGAPAILTAMPTSDVAAADDADPIPMWDNEGGHPVEAFEQPPISPHPLAASS
ncbi:DUF5994 family protein [Dactylosporangium sp. McL0621]|uniref:DUF5994 family protein n=1 Tax=Dactylosporangium sp. McL0621 TaxID=3415678 RepID=UPI003CEA2CB0